MATLQACYANILSKKITATFGHYVPYKTLAVEKSISGKSNIIIAKELDAIDRSNVFTDLLQKMSFAAYEELGGIAAGLTLIQPSGFESVSLTDANCDAITFFLSS
jgi:hypothetical protein